MNTPKLFTAPYFHVFYSIVENADRTARELNASAKRKTSLGKGWGPKKNRGAIDIFGKSEFSVSQETVNSHWLKGD